MLLKCLVYTDMVCLDLNSSQNWIYNYYGKMPAIGKRLIFKFCCSIGTASVNSVELDLGCTSRIYFDNVTLTLHNMGFPDCNIINSFVASGVLALTFVVC